MKRNLGKAIALTVGLIGFAASVVQLLTTPGRMGWIAILSVSAALLSVAGWAWLGGRRSRKHADSALPGRNEVEDLSVGYHLVPATRAEINWIAELEKEIYGPRDAVPGNVLLEWYDTNPHGFFVIKTRWEEKVGHLNLLAVRPKTLEQFLAGRIVEREIRGDSLYMPAERASIKELYVESIILRAPEGRSKGPAALTCALNNLIPLVGNLCELKNLKRVYAIAATDKGEGLMEKLGFDLFQAAEDRADGHNLFAVEFPALSTRIPSIRAEYSLTS